MRNLWKSAWLVALGVILLAAGTAMAVLAQEGETETPPVVRQVSDDEVNEVAKDLYCPVCENTPLDVCGTKACADWRELIRTKLAQGETPQDVFNYFARQYGESVLAKPPREGINLVLWLFPIVAVVLGLVFFARYLQGIRAQSAETVGGTGPETAVSQPPPSADDYAARVEQELHKK